MLSWRVDQILLILVMADDPARLTSFYSFTQKCRYESRQGDEVRTVHRIYSDSYAACLSRVFMVIDTLDEVAVDDTRESQV